MTVTVASFKEAFSEFAQTNPTKLAAQLALVEQTTSDGIDANLRDSIVMLTLADRLANTPGGRDAQPGEGGRVTTYWLQLQTLVKANGCVHPDRFGTLPSGLPVLDE